jgi:hypothetical protein
MEHRWGERVEVDIPVQVSVPPHALGTGRIRDISISGAWIVGRFPLAPLARALVVFDLLLAGRHESLPLACYVARVQPDGIGVEWRELSPQILGELMLLASPAQTRTEPAREVPDVRTVQVKNLAG